MSTKFMAQLVTVARQQSPHLTKNHNHVINEVQMILEHNTHFKCSPPKTYPYHRLHWWMHDLNARV